MLPGKATLGWILGSQGVRDYTLGLGSSFVMHPPTIPRYGPVHQLLRRSGPQSSSVTVWGGDQVFRVVARSWGLFCLSSSMAVSAILQLTASWSPSTGWGSPTAQPSGEFKDCQFDGAASLKTSWRVPRLSWFLWLIMAALIAGIEEKDGLSELRAAS